MPTKRLGSFPTGQKSDLKADIAELGQLLQERRMSLGLTQEQLAEALEVSYSTIKYIEQGRRSPSLLLLLKVSRALGLQLALDEK